METKNIFGIPTYTFKFELHDILKARFMRSITDDKFSSYKMHRSGDFRLSHPTIHKDKLFEPLTKFCNDSYNIAMEDMGFTQKCCINSMWISEQKAGARHRPHQHFNCFLIGVYYLHGTTGAPGTSLFNHNLGSIMPARNYSKPAKMTFGFQSPFIEGTFFIFPTFVTHYTERNLSADTRYIIASNSMPIGKVKWPPHDKYEYMDISESNLEMTDQEYEIFLTNKSKGKC